MQLVKIHSLDRALPTPRCYLPPPGLPTSTAGYLCRGVCPGEQERVPLLVSTNASILSDPVRPLHIDHGMPPQRQATAAQRTVDKRPSQQWYEFSVTSTLLGQKFPHPFFGGRLIQYLHGAVRVQYTCTAVVTGQATF